MKFNLRDNGYKNIKLDDRYIKIFHAKEIITKHSKLACCVHYRYTCEIKDFQDLLNKELKAGTYVRIDPCRPYFDHGLPTINLNATVGY